MTKDQRRVRQPRRPATSPSPGSSTSVSASRPALIVALIVAIAAVVLATHWPALSAQASTFDDGQYWRNNPLVQNPGWASAGRFFGEVLRPSTVEGYYQPLTMVSLMLDRARGARVDDLRPVHRTNLALHVATTALILLLLYQLFGNPWVAGLIALLFGLHPMTVEPIAWVTERKTLLSAFFSLGSLVLYVAYVRHHSWTAYATALLALALALLAKPTSTPLPVLLLLLDCWPLRRLSKRALLEKLPFFVLAGAFAIITVISQSRAAWIMPPQERTWWWPVLTSCHNIVFYLRTLIWPTHLTLWHPYPEPFDLSQPALRVGLIGTLSLIVLLLISLRWTRALCIGGLFFLVALFPTLGVIGFTVIIASSKYAYLPAVGLLLILAAGLGWCWNNPQPAARMKAARTAALIVVLTAAALAAWRTQVELRPWQTTERLYRHMLTLADEAGPLHNDLGLELLRQGRVPEAIEQYQAAVRSRWGVVQAHLNLGNALEKQGQIDEAISHYVAALELRPDDALAHRQLGHALLVQERWPAAQAELEQSLRLKPDLTAAYIDLGVLLARQGQYEQARAPLLQALRIEPTSLEARGNLALVLVRLGQLEEGIQHFQAALRIDPERFELHVNLADALRKQERLDQAASEFRQAIRLRPDYPYSYMQLGEILTAQHRPDEAVQVYQAGLRANPADRDLRARLLEAQSGDTATRPASQNVPKN